jgi:hypothetical protein
MNLDYGYIHPYDDWKLLLEQKIDKSRDSSTTAIVSKIYPLVTNHLDKGTNKLKQVIGNFIERRSKELYDTAPYDRIYFGSQDIDEFYQAMQFTSGDIKNLLRETYYYDIGNFNPAAAKDEFTVTVMMIIRYFYLKKMEKELELATIYLAFSGKFYPSIHYGSFPKVQPSEHRHVMEYVVNNELTQKFDLKREGSIFGAIKSICKTWLHSYSDRLKSADDEDVVYLIQQLHNRIKSFMKNIAEIYYKVYADKDHYLTYDSDNTDEENYRVADNDSLKIERAVEKSMEFLNSRSINYSTCKMASDSNVRTDEVKSIMETILTNNDNIIETKELIRIIITQYFQISKDKDIRNIDFITTSITAKPNTKDDKIIRQKQIIETWLDENSPAYRKRKSREATKSSYYKSVLTYFVLTIHQANK